MPQMTLLKNYTLEAAKEIQKSLAKFDAKSAKGEGTFEVIATIEVEDRDGEVIKVDGMDAVNFMKNPVIIWGHNYWDMNALIGAATEVIVQENLVIVRGIFARTPSGQMARQLYEDGILKAVSIGFIPKERSGNLITKWELLELSFVSVPSNPDALDTEKQKALDAFAEMMTVSLKAAPDDAGHNSAQKLCEACKCNKVDDGDTKSIPLTAQTLKAIDACIEVMTELRSSAEAEEVVKQATIVDDTVKASQQLQKLVERVITNAKKIKS